MKYFLVVSLVFVSLRHLYLSSTTTATLPGILQILYTLRTILMKKLERLSWPEGFNLINFYNEFNTSSVVKNTMSIIEITKV